MLEFVKQSNDAVGNCSSELRLVSAEQRHWLVLFERIAWTAATPVEHVSDSISSNELSNAR